MWMDPFEEMKRIQNEMANLMRDFFESTKYLKSALPIREPPVELRETKDNLIIYVELPGVDKKDIQLDLTDNTLEIKVEKRTNTKIKKENIIKSERSYTGYYRSITLPCKVDNKNVKATFNNGLLEIILPKVEKKKVKKKIKIN